MPCGRSEARRARTAADASSIDNHERAKMIEIQAGTRAKNGVSQSYKVADPHKPIPYRSIDRPTCSPQNSRQSSEVRLREWRSSSCLTFPAVADR